MENENKEFEAIMMLAIMTLMAIGSAETIEDKEEILNSCPTDVLAMMAVLALASKG